MEEIESQQNETKAWQQELLLHDELAGTLKPRETLALIGSFTESSLEARREENETGGLSDYDFGVEKRTHDVALEQLSTLEVTAGDSTNDVIYNRQKEIEAALEAVSTDPKHHAEQMKLREQLAGLKLLDAMYLNVIDNVDVLAATNGDGNKHNPRNRAAAINTLIEQHNEHVSGGIDSGLLSPEAQVAQERVNAQNSTQVAQTVLTETPEDAQQKVAEAYDDTGEKERQTLISEVAQAAKGATRIHTDRPNGVALKSSSGDYVPRDGFASFGDGLPQESRYGHGTMLEYGGSAEAMLFAPDTTTRYKTVTKNVNTGGRFMKKTEQITDQVPDGEVPKMVVNPATGQEEPGVKAAYQFNGNSRYENGQPVSYEGPAYVTENGRSGNQLFVEVTLPKSVADKLKQAAADNAETAREFAKTLAMNNGITEQVWDRIVRPPYDQIPDGWEMTVADLQLNQYGHHDMVSRQAVRVVR